MVITVDALKNNFYRHSLRGFKVTLSQDFFFRTVPFESKESRVAGRKKMFWYICLQNGLLSVVYIVHRSTIEFVGFFSSPMNTLNVRYGHCLVLHSKFPHREKAKRKGRPRHWFCIAPNKGPKRLTEIVVRFSKLLRGYNHLFLSFCLKKNIFRSIARTLRGECQPSGITD